MLDYVQTVRRELNKNFLQIHQQSIIRPSFDWMCRKCLRCWQKVNSVHKMAFYLVCVCACVVYIIYLATIWGNSKHRASNGKNTIPRKAFMLKYHFSCSLPFHFIFSKFHSLVCRCSQTGISSNLAKISERTQLADINVTIFMIGKRKTLFIFCKQFFVVDFSRICFKWSKINVYKKCVQPPYIVMDSP